MRFEFNLPDPARCDYCPCLREAGYPFKPKCMLGYIIEYAWDEKHTYEYPLRPESCKEKHGR